MQLKIAFLLTIVFLITGCSLVFKETESERIEKQKIVEKVQNSKLIILDVYHNNCSDCKLIEPVIKKLENDYSINKDIAFLKYDLSSPVTIFKSKQIAKALGLEHIYNLQKYSGVVLFIDSKKKHVMDTLIAVYDEKKYNEVIKQRLSEVK